MLALLLALVVVGNEPAAEAVDQATTPTIAKPTKPATRSPKAKAANLVALPSSPDLLVGVVRSDIAGGFLVFADGFEPVSASVADDQRTVTWEGRAGRYAVLFFPPGQITQPQVVRVELGGATPEPPTPENPYPAPPAADRQALAPVMAISTSKADAKALAGLYGRAAELIETGLAARAAGAVPEQGTPAELRSWLVEHGRELGLAGQYPGLSDAVDSALAELLGLDASRQLTTTDARGFRSLAWAVWEGSR